MHSRSQIQIDALYYTIYFALTYVIMMLVLHNIPSLILSKDVQSLDLNSVVYSERIYQVISPLHKLLFIPSGSIYFEKIERNKMQVKNRAVYIKFVDKEVLINPENDEYFYDNRRDLAPITYGLLQDKRIKDGKLILVEQVYEYDK